MQHSFDLTLSALAAAYREGTTTPRALITELRSRAGRLNPEFNLFIYLLSPGELEPYLLALERSSPEALPLYGIPFAIKDNIDLAGVPTTAACPAFATVPAHSAVLVSQLIALGAVPLGKTNLDQFATGLNGTRSPYGACRNSVHPDYPAGGSSSGSALAVALGVVSFALGTDTAGSGRVPAALNNLVGLKPTKGLLSTTGVLPACRTLDCVTFLTATAREASQLFALTAGHDPLDAYSRTNPGWNRQDAFGAPAPGFRFGVPETTEFYGCEESRVLFDEARARLEALGGVAVHVDMSPFIAAARLLYEGPWVAERYQVIGPLMERDPQAVLPVIAEVLASAPGIDAVATFSAIYQLQAYKAQCDAILAELDCVLTPTYPRPVTLQELEAEPVKSNAALGYYTNFMNLLDYAAVAVPAGFMSHGLPSGVTLFGRAFTDQYLLSLADAFQRASALPLPGGQVMAGPPPAAQAGGDRTAIVVCGAHMHNLPLNAQLTERGGVFIAQTVTAPRYRLYALADGRRPGLIRDEEQGSEIEVEVWSLPCAEVGSFLALIAHPLGLGRIELRDGRWLTGFICEASGRKGSKEISHFGGWRNWLAATLPA
ncbi:allophanate hydrolase [Pluralibacter gergoviae]|uniref:allophanate hydrolase n=1 Tax=Pluralibacter gergoviae TaxID=61647 RepID=UPI00190C8522|nr:allophanate hydrolase [Pluralibacter gergoviae]ELC3075836.1 allophanate hydrolase [Pluralibacter gergoviae]MBK4117274.1 allophanate hydrolase [Pluralibacter gergoviae]